jgi:hypothetical protein
MRRLCAKLALFVAVVLVGCEDGPKQLFTPSPAGAGQQWNDGNTGPVTAANAVQSPACAPSATDPSGMNGACAKYPTVGKTTICSADIKRARWAWMLNQPIIPPRFYAGLDMAKDDLWHGLGIEDAEQAPSGDPGATGGGLCQSVPLGFQGQCPSGISYCNGNYWGNAQEVSFSWNLATHKLDQFNINLGYLGTFTVKSKDGKHTFVLKLGDVPKKDDQPFLLDWTGNPRRSITEFYNAAIATYGPAAGLAPIDTLKDAMGHEVACTADFNSHAPMNSCNGSHPFCISGTCVPNCGSDGSCLVTSGGGQWFMGFRQLVFYVVGNTGVPQPALSTPVLFYNFASRFEPFGNLPQVLKLDPEGPYAKGPPLGARDNTISCAQQVGVKFKDVRTNCVQVHGPSGNPDMVDQVNLNKLLNGLTHDQEHWTANAIGVNQNFTSEKVVNNPDIVVLDEDTPQDGDFAQDFFFDLRARGHPRNDYNTYDGATGAVVAPGASYGASWDNRGTAMIHIEWARLMLLDINKIMKAQGLIPQSQPPKKIGDPDCTNGNFKAGCSGIEGLMIPGGPALSGNDFSKDASCANAATCLDPGKSWDGGGLFLFASHLKPGDVIAGFCGDPATEGDCFQAVAGGAASPFYTAQYWVQSRLGKGNILQVPSELRDRRYYFKWYAAAYIKYLKAYSNFDATLVPDGKGGMVAMRDFWPCSKAVDATCTNSGVGPNDVANVVIDYESLFYDNNELGGSNSFDKFEYIDRENIGKGQEGTDAQKYNFVPWDFEYGCDLIAGNQRYDNYFRRMDREEIALFAAMLQDKTHTPGQENNVNITNLFGTAIVPSVWPNLACATGSAGDPAMSGCPNPPMDTSEMTLCDAAGKCTAGPTNNGTCLSNIKTWETGVQSICARAACDFTAHPATGCAAINQTCVTDGTNEGCADMMMDLNGTQSNAHPLLWYYPGVWSRTPFSMGHSPITLAPADKKPNIGIAKITIPNFKVDCGTDGNCAGPYTNSPQVATGTICPTNWHLDGTGTLCNAPLDTGSNMHAPSFVAPVPWLEQQPGIGFTFPINGQQDQAVTTGQLDFTGVLETYLIDYIPWTDLHKAGCAGDDPTSASACNKGYTCNPVTRACEASDNTIRIMAIESSDYLGEVFLCQDPLTGDILHVRQYDSAHAILDWFAAHTGGFDPSIGGAQPTAEVACSVIVKWSPYNNYIDYITSKAYGVKLSINQGAGLGRVIDSTLYDPSIVQAQ